MKPAPFEYRAPSSQEEAVDLLQKFGDEAKILAGGQSLVPLLNFRLARPKVIIDINRVDSLNRMNFVGGQLSIGALTRQYAIEQDAHIKSRLPILPDVCQYIGHPQIRNRGTVCGSLAHADPAAELPAVARALGATMTTVSSRGTRKIPADKFFISALTTALRPDELLASASFPIPKGRYGWDFQEVSVREGDFALVGVAALVFLETNSQRCREASIVLCGVGPTPVRASGAEKLLKGESPTSALLDEVKAKVSEEIEPESDIHVSREYRKSVGGHLAAAALRNAFRKAGIEFRA